MRSFLFILVVFAFLLNGCGTQQFTEGEYDDVKSENLLDDQWYETDMQVVVQELVASLKKHRAISAAPKPPLVMVTRLQNKTSEHIDTQSVTDMLVVEVMRGGDVQFVDKAAREDIAEEYDYQNSGMVDGASKKGPGGQAGADYIINGRLDSIVKEVGKRKTVYYKVTLNLTNLKTGVIMWSDYKELRKKIKKQTVGL